MPIEQELWSKLFPYFSDMADIKCFIMSWLKNPGFPPQTFPAQIFLQTTISLQSEKNQSAYLSVLSIASSIVFLQLSPPFLSPKTYSNLL